MTPQKPDEKPNVSMVDTIARKYVVPLAIILDVIALCFRILETSSQLVLPDAYNAWNQHRGAVLTVIFDLVQVLVIIAIAVGTSAFMFLAMPLHSQIDRRIDAAQGIRNKRNKKEMLGHLRTKKQRYTQLIFMAASIPLLFGVSYFLAGFHWGVLTIVTAITDIAAPIIILYGITSTEREYGAVDPQEHGMATANNVVIAAVGKIGENFGADKPLTLQQAQMLRHASEGDLDGMITDAMPADHSVKFYTVSQLCERFGVDGGRDSADRKRISRIIAAAFANGVHVGDVMIKQDTRRRTWLVPGPLLDQLFPDYTDQSSRALPLTRQSIAVQPAPSQVPSGLMQDIRTQKIPYGPEPTLAEVGG